MQFKFVAHDGSGRVEIRVLPLAAPTTFSPGRPVAVRTDSDDHERPSPSPSLLQVSSPAARGTPFKNATPVVSAGGLRARTDSGQAAHAATSATADRIARGLELCCSAKLRTAWRALDKAVSSLEWAFDLVVSLPARVSVRETR